jgi:hypothetical protein
MYKFALLLSFIVMILNLYKKGFQYRTEEINLNSEIDIENLNLFLSRKRNKKEMRKMVVGYW